MAKKRTLRKKLRRLFRKESRKNFLLGFKGDEWELFDKLPLDAYYPLLEQTLTDDEFFELQSMFIRSSELGWVNLIPSNRWFDRCCRDFRVFDNLSNVPLETILNECWERISELFGAQAQTGSRRYRIMKLLHEDKLDNWIRHLKVNDFSKFSPLSQFLISLYEKEKYGEADYQREDATRLFQKLANISDEAIAMLVENTDGCVARRILQERQASQREIFPIYAEVYKFLKEEDKVEFVKEIFRQKEIGGFADFYEILSSEEKERMFELLLEDNAGREVAQNFLNVKKEEEMTFFEKVIKEHYF